MSLKGGALGRIKEDDPGIQDLDHPPEEAPPGGHLELTFDGDEGLTKSKSMSRANAEHVAARAPVVRAVPHPAARSAASPVLYFLATVLGRVDDDDDDDDDDDGDGDVGVDVINLMMMVSIMV